MIPTEEPLRENEVVQATAFFLSKLNASVVEAYKNDPAMRFKAFTGVIASLVSSICADREGKRRLEFEDLLIKKITDQLADRSLPDLRIKIDGY